MAIVLDGLNQFTGFTSHVVLMKPGQNPIQHFSLNNGFGSKMFYFETTTIHQIETEP